MGVWGCLSWLVRCLLGWLVPEPAPPKRRGVPRRLRKQLWRRYHGDERLGVCYCCGVFIERDTRHWHAAHVTAVVEGGEDHLDNLRTTCAYCNLSMGRRNLYDFILTKDLLGPGRRRASECAGDTTQVYAI